MPNSNQATSSETTSGRKRSQKSPQAKTKNIDSTEQQKPIDEDENNNNTDESLRENRQSLRIRNKPNSSVSPQPQPTVTKTKKSAKESKKLANTSSSSSSSTSSSNLSMNDRKLNGAQFVAAASAGNISTMLSSLNNSNNTATPTNIESNQQDLVQLNRNVEMLNKTLVQHSMLIKLINGSIEKLSNKLDMVKKQVNSKLIVSSAEYTSLPAAKRQKLSSGESNNVQTTDITASSSLIEEENIVINENQFDDESETNNNKNQTDQPQAQAQQSQLKEEQSNSPLKQFTAAAASNNVITEQVTEPNATTPTPTTQTVKLTNCDQMTEETASHQSNSFYYLSDSSKSDQDDDDDEDDDDEDDVETHQNNNNKKQKKSSLNPKSPTKAILNKTKIDTEFISKLIANKNPNDKRYDPNEINKLRLLSHSYQNFAVKLLIRLFDEEEIIGRNVYGRNYSGDKTFMKQPLDPERINFIKETVLKLTRTNNPDLAWASCVIAMNRKMVDINNKFIKSQKNE